jgi:hypothetical protein
MSISKRNLCLALLLVTTVGVQVGCGRGRSQRPTIGNRGAMNNKMNTDNKGTTPDAGAESNSDVGANAESAAQLAALTQQEEALNTGVEQLKERGQLIGQGDYTLKSITTTYHYMKQQNDYRSLFTSAVNINGTDVTFADAGNAQIAGSMAPEADQGVQVEVPVKFALKADGTIVRDGSLVKTLANQTLDSKINNSFLADNAALANSLMNILTGAEAAKNVTVTFNKVDERKLRVRLSIEESKSSENAGDIAAADTPLIVRNLYLDYELLASAAAANSTTAADEAAAKDAVNTTTSIR